MLEKELLFQCFDVPNDDLRLQFILLIRWQRTLSTGENSDIIRESHRGDIFRMPCENRLMVIVEILHDDIATDTVGKESIVGVPDEILSPVTVVTNDRL